MGLKLFPINKQIANSFVNKYHRHNREVLIARIWIGLLNDDELIGVAITGNPVERWLAHRPDIAEVRRVAVKDGSPLGSCSMLYGACWRAWKAMGGTKLITYNLDSESGASLKGAGWIKIREAAPSCWHKGTARVSEYQPVFADKKYRWEIKSSDFVEDANYDYLKTLFKDSAAA